MLHLVNKYLTALLVPITPPFHNFPRVFGMFSFYSYLQCHIFLFLCTFKIGSSVFDLVRLYK